MYICLINLVIRLKQLMGQPLFSFIMNQSLFNSMNPLQEHLANQGAIQRQNNIIGYCLTFCLVIIVCLVILTNLHSFRIKYDKKEET